MFSINLICNGLDTPVVYLEGELDARLYELSVNYKILLNVIDTDLLIYSTPELIILRNKILTQPRPPMVDLKVAERLYKFRLLNVGKHTHKETLQRKLKKALELIGYNFKETTEKSFTFSIFRLSEIDESKNSTVVNFAQNNTAEEERRNLERLTGYTCEEINAHAHNNQQAIYKSYEYLLANSTLEIVKIIIE